ncbi:hypothetical protein ESCO_003661 [Escovopsis weberi]|uniref:Uncharacterized protein n=1 Tax=Escovopsis weberi TaxID=150374 RepID=A0A0M8NAD6_ESCWE|nr:hypothetical protein ESCO_003661 [Escovopsis weberi]
MVQEHIWVGVDPRATPRLFLIDSGALHRTVPRISINPRYWAHQMSETLTEAAHNGTLPELQRGLCRVFSCLREYSNTGELLMLGQEELAFSYARTAEQRAPLLDAWVDMACLVCECLGHDSFLGCSDLLFEYMLERLSVLFARADSSTARGRAHAERLFFAASRIYRPTKQAYLDWLNGIWGRLDAGLRDELLRKLRMDRLWQGNDKGWDRMYYAIKHPRRPYNMGNF